MINTERLINVLSIQSYSGKQFRMFAYIIRQLKTLGATYYVNNGNVYATKGKSAKGFPCMVAHMDTVHQIEKDLTVVQAKHGFLTAINSDSMKQTGIGGDDKVGVYIALEMLRKHKNMKVAFFRDEETGCKGSYLADLKFFEDVNFVLQCDRKGHTDFITDAGMTELSSKEFQNAVEPHMNTYGYKFTTGLMTDVMALKEKGLKVSSANISCGYYNPHSSSEFVSIAGVGLATMLVNDIITKLGATKFKHEYVKKAWTSGYSGNGYRGGYGDEYADYEYNEGKWDYTANRWVSNAEFDYNKEFSNAWYALRTFDKQTGKWILKSRSEQKRIKKMRKSKYDFYRTHAWNQQTMRYEKTVGGKNLTLVHTPPSQTELQKAARDMVEDSMEVDEYDASGWIFDHESSTWVRPVQGSVLSDGRVWSATEGAWVLPLTEGGEDIYCADCHAEVADKHGLCPTCFSHYQSEFGYFPEDKSVTIKDVKSEEAKKQFHIDAAPNHHDADDTMGHGIGAW